MIDIERHVLEMIGEDPDNPDVFTESSDDFQMIRNSVQDAIEEICMLKGCVKSTYYLQMKEGKTFYLLDVNDGYYGWITDVWMYSQTRRLAQTDVHRLNTFNWRWLLNTGTPEAYFPIGFDHIGVWPKPASDAGVLEIDMVIIPRGYDSDNDRVRLREQFKWAAVDYAVSEYWASRGDAKAAMEMFMRYLDRIEIKRDYLPSGDYRPQFQTEKQPWPTL